MHKPCDQAVTPEVRRLFAEDLLAWFSAHRRALPWRVEYAPYQTWIAEVMMQQTQMERGVEYFTRWMRRFPTIASVACAPEDDVLRAWEGLGYYRRARYVQAAARRIMQDFGGEFPQDMASIRSLPGVGEYSAAAIASTAFGVDVACVDGNVERVLSRVFDIEENVKTGAGKRTVRTLADHLLVKGHARDFNQALMELGALVCRKNPECAACPLSSVCLARQRGTTALRPVSGSTARVVPVAMSTGILRCGERIFVQRRLQDDRVWAGLWEFPGGVQEENETPEAAVIREFSEETGFRVRVVRPLGIIRHGYTVYRLTMRAFELALDNLPTPAGPALPSGATPAPDTAPALQHTARQAAPPGEDAEPPVPTLHEAQEYRWARPKELAALPMPAPHRKLVERCGFGPGCQAGLFD